MSNVAHELDYLIFLGTLRDKRFTFVGLSFRRFEIDFDVGFIVRATNMNEIQMPLLRGHGALRPHHGARTLLRVCRRHRVPYDW
jgi:hypothetical protein